MPLSSTIAVVVLTIALTTQGQPLRELPTRPTCVDECLLKNKGCQQCVYQLTNERFSTPREMTLPFHKVHDTVPDPETRLRHHHFLDRPPWVPGSHPEHHKPGDGKVMAEGKVHSNCPAMRARTALAGITLKMPYTIRFFRSGLIEVDCHWISGEPTHSVKIDHPVDSPWIRLPQSHLQIFTVGDSRADVWIINSGVYVDDAEYMSSPGATPGDKGGSSGNKWLLLPMPHKLKSTADRAWGIEQGVLSSFQRTSRNANIPLQLNFSAVPAKVDFIEIKKGTPMMQYVPAVLPRIALQETPMPAPLADYLVMLSEMHGGGDIRKLKALDKGAYDVMRSYQLKENPGYVQSHIKPKNKAHADL